MTEVRSIRDVRRWVSERIGDRWGADYDRLVDEITDQLWADGPHGDYDWEAYLDAIDLLALAAATHAAATKYSSTDASVSSPSRGRRRIWVWARTLLRHAVCSDGVVRAIYESKSGREVIVVDGRAHRRGWRGITWET